MSDDRPSPVTWAEAIAFWWKLGLISFGGPAGQIALMHAELVDRKRWISEHRFLHALNYCMVLPGPEAQQLATYLGWLLHGTWGGIIAGTLFILPSFLLLIALSAAYVALADVGFVAGLLDGVKAAVVAIVVQAVVRIGRRTLTHPAWAVVALAAFAALASGRVAFPWIVLAAATVGWAGYRAAPHLFPPIGGHAKKTTRAAGGGLAVIDDHDPPPPQARVGILRLLGTSAVGAVLWALPLVALAMVFGPSSTLVDLGLFFTQAALLTFGGAYAVLPFVTRHAEQAGWLSSGQMIDGLALGETTPGPLIIVVTFVGFVGGWQQAGHGWVGAVLGGTVATYFTFLPSFVFILVGAPLVERTRSEIQVGAALSGVTAAVVGVVAHLALFFADRTFFPPGGWHAGGRLDLFAVALAGAAWLALARWKASVAWVVIAAAVGGLLHWALVGGSPG